MGNRQNKDKEKRKDEEMVLLEAACHTSDKLASLPQEDNYFKLKNNSCGNNNGTRKLILSLEKWAQPGGLQVNSRQLNPPPPHKFSLLHPVV